MQCPFEAFIVCRSEVCDESFIHGGVAETQSLRKSAALSPGATAKDTSGSFSRWQQGAQAVVGVS